jgi:uncharacterized protein (TIGR03086 family)
MMDDTFDPRALFLRTLDQLENVVSGITPEQLELPTPCTEYDLRALVGHTVGAMHRVAYMGEGGRGLDLAPAAGDIADTDWGGAVARAKARATAAWQDDEKLDWQIEVPWGMSPGRIALSGYVLELTTHTWDIAQAADSKVELDEELAQVALGIAQTVLPAERRGGPIPFGPVQPVPEDADVYTRLAGWLGRAV